MDQLRAAAQHALESLRGYRREMQEHQPCDAEVALAAALEQPEPEPVAMHRLMKKEGSAWMPATEWVTGDPDASWLQLVTNNPNEWRISKPLDGKAVADAFRAALEQPEQDQFCDSHCTWLDHHPECVRAKQERNA
jgi:hypothetical protein